MNSDNTAARLRLDRALDCMASTFRGATAREDETQCDCHWGSEEELALLKVPDVELGPDLLYRTWNASYWRDHGAVLRRILPEFSRALVGGSVEPLFGIHDVGRSFSRGRWQEWPALQSEAVWEFLHAWWAQTLSDPSPAFPAHEALTLCVEASKVLGPWLRAWETVDHPVADQHLVAAAACWEYSLLGDELPWNTTDGENEDALRTELASWLVGHAQPRLRAQNAPDELLHRVRLMGLTGPARWSDPHFPDRRY
ncbi:hypothetical protein ABZ930_01330 [Streptomyces sp. NPDC046716]|uniref:hypothetical protein n=1 Tax=Streptomyces sp. NPDC046716 TaxID=3157093 RepID=UPI0033C9A5A9